VDRKTMTRLGMGVNDVFAFLGWVMMGIGLWMWSPAAALTVCGIVLLGLAILGEARRKT